MKVLVIFNPVAGVKKKNQYELISDVLKNRDIDFEVIKTTEEKGPFEILDNFEKSFTHIVTCGGDGTVSETIKGMHHYHIDLPLLILPVGTSNEIAQNLGLKDDSIPNVLQRLFGDKSKCVDYGLFNEEDTFAYTMTFGNFTEVTYETPQKMKNWLGYRAYFLYAFLSFRGIKSYKLKVNANGKDLSGDYLFGVVSNSQTIGQIIKYNKNDISLNDGLFEVLLMKKPNGVNDLRLIIKGLLQNNYNNKMFEKFKAKKISLGSKKAIDWNVDGEFAGSFKKVKIENLHKKIQLII